MIISSDDTGAHSNMLPTRVSRRIRRRDRRLRMLATALGIPMVFAMAALTIGVIEYTPTLEQPIEARPVIANSLNTEAEFAEHGERLMEQDAARQRRRLRRLERRRAEGELDIPLP